ncbi:MAG: hypothetical protein WBB02_03855 [Saprospiraceae bacterium]
MRLMTYSDELDGLITIEEANDNGPQNVIFTIPLEMESWSKIKSKEDLQLFFRNNRIGVNILERGMKKNIILNYELKTDVLSFNYFGKTIKFFIDFELNLETKCYSINIYKSSWIKHLNRMYNILKRLMLHKENINFNSDSNQCKLAYKYVGSKNRPEFDDSRFIVVSLNSTEELDNMYKEYQTFIIN